MNSPSIYMHSLSFSGQTRRLKSVNRISCLNACFPNNANVSKSPIKVPFQKTLTESWSKKKTKGVTLQSPYDPDASYGHKGSGYSLHVTETCNNVSKSEIITDYEGHGAGRSDAGKTLSVLERLTETGLKPETLFADGGYPSVPSTLTIIRQQVEFMAPVNRGPLADSVVGRDRFQFSSDGRVIKCPMGFSPIDHRILSANNTTRRSLHAIFDGEACRSCNMLDRCPVRAPNHRDRGCQHCDTVGNFRLEITPELRLRDQMYIDQQTCQWKERYKIRSGIEATNSELKRSHGIGRLRVRRAVKVCFAVACKLTACNIKRWAKAYFYALRGFFKSLIGHFVIGLQSFVPYSNRILFL